MNNYIHGKWYEWKFNSVRRRRNNGMKPQLGDRYARTFRLEFEGSVHVTCHPVEDKEEGTGTQNPYHKKYKLVCLTWQGMGRFSGSQCVRSAFSFWVSVWADLDMAYWKWDYQKAKTHCTATIPFNQEKIHELNKTMVNAPKTVFWACSSQELLFCSFRSPRRNYRLKMVMKACYLSMLK